MRLARAVSILALLVAVCGLSTAIAGPSNYPAASIPPKLQPGWDAEPNQLDPSAPADEAQGGITEAGTPISKRVEACFPAEQRDVFPDVDMVVGPDRNLRRFSYLEGGSVTPQARDAIRGKNTWLLWGEGNEVFWDWVQQHGYGLADFLILLDSRQRDRRFKEKGLVNQPGMRAQIDPAKKILGLYIDEADGGKIVLRQPPTDVDASTSALVVRPLVPEAHGGRALFEPGDPALYQRTLAQLPDDGLDPTVYGYASGIVGLRLFPNPNFFGNTGDAQKARERWKERVEEAEDDAYYTNSSINADPKLVRPFRVSMSCGFCHISPHPLNPPVDPEEPEWSNLSSTIGDQYWTPVATFTNLKKPDSFLYQFLLSQQPGTIDTSLVSTDHINNPNTITAIFDVPARLDRAKRNSREEQSPSNLLVPYVEEPGIGVNPRYTPRVLLDGADSIGVFGALSRVYLNIGAYSEEWKRLHNTVIGFTAQRPFSVATARKNSVYWRAADKYRIPYLAAFFTYRNKETGEHVTQPMHLSDAPDSAERAKLDAEREIAAKGRTVFIQNCAICHSSKQPEGLWLSFSRDWRAKQTLNPVGPLNLTLPLDFADWPKFTMGQAYAEYVKQISALAGEVSGPSDPFIKDNFLSTEVRVPITLVGTNSGRAVATNAMRGQIWDNFSSEAYKRLEAVGEVHFFNPFSAKPVDSWGNNDSYTPPGGGPGYYRPASLISLWATAPYLHNNALGRYTHDPSVKGRLEAFDDGIDKILWSAKRDSVALQGDLRGKANAAANDTGFIYRTTQASWIDFPAPFIRQLVTGIIGTFWTSFLTTYVWVGLAVISLALVFLGRTRHAGFIFALVAVISVLLLYLSRIDMVYPTLWFVPALAAAGAGLLWFVLHNRWIARAVFLVLGAIAVFAGVGANAFVDGKLGDLKVGPIPAGTPVNLIMNLNPEAPIRDLLNAAFGMTRGMLRIRKGSLQGDDAWEAFKEEAAEALMRVSKCPDFVLDRGHWFAEALTDQEKRQLKAFLKTL